MRRLSAWVTLLLLTLLPAAALAQAEEPRPTLSGAGGAAGIGQYPPSSWGVVAATINNPTAREQQLLVTFNFTDTATLQFATDVWVPPGTRRTIWLPMRTNQFEISETRPMTLPLRQQLIDNAGAQPVVLGEADGMLIASRDRWITGMLADGDDSDDEAISVALAIRRSVEYSRRMAYLNERNLPSMVAGWQGMNALVISKNSLALDSAQTEAMRQWLLAGGKLWVMLDHVEPDVMPALLGDAWTVREVDRVRLSTVMVEPPASARFRLAIDDDLTITFEGKKLATLPDDPRGRQQAMERVKTALRQAVDKEIEDGAGDTRFRIHITGGVSGEIALLMNEAVREVGGQDALVERDHEQPVDFVRVLAPDMEVTHTVNGWPAAMRKPVGKGWLMVTTLGARGWMEKVLVPQTTVDGTESKDDKGRVIQMWAHGSHRPLREIADWFHTDRRAEVLPPEAFDAYVSEQIGYQIVGRGTVFFVLLVFCASLLGAGLWMMRSARLEHLGWIGASIAVVIALVLVLIGKANQSSVPMTVAQGQFVQVAPDQQQATTTGLICIYNPGGAVKRGETAGPKLDDTEATLEATAGGLILPADLAKLQTRQVGMVWTDVDRFHWRNVTMPTGANRRATFERVTPLNRPVRASITFDANGVVGHYRPGDIGPLSTMVIATPNGALATRASTGAKPGELQGYGDITFTAGAAEALSAGQYVSSGVIDDVQRRKQDVYRTLLGGGDDEADDPLANAIAQKKAPADKTKLGAAGRARRFPDEPTLLGWADALPLGFRFPDAQQKLGASLVAIPLAIERPAAGAPITLPSAFLPYKVTRGRYGPTPAVFVEERQVWNASSVPGTLPLAFRVPAALLPLTVEKAKFTLDMISPGATVEVLVDRGGTLQSVTKVSSPTAAIVVDLPAADVQPNAQGEVLVIFRVSYTTPGERTLWRVKEAKLEVKGVVK